MLDGDIRVLDLPEGFRDWSLFHHTLLSDVYRARDSSGQDVVVKVLRFAGDEPVGPGAGVGRELAGCPGVVPVLDAGTTPNGRPWLTMRFYPAGSVAEELSRRGRLDVSRAVDLVVAVADTLALAHARGVLHRDVKPANILLTESGDPLLTDFETAALLRPGHLSATATALSDDYAAPEVLVDGRYTAHSEVYGAAATLFELLCGQPPFRRQPGESPGRHYQRVVAALFPEELVPPGTPEGLVGVLRRGLHADPARRPAGAAELAAELRAVQVLLGLRPRPAGDGSVQASSTRLRPRPQAARDDVDPAERSATSRGLRLVLPGAVVAVAVLTGTVLVLSGGSAGGRTGPAAATGLAPAVLARSATGGGEPAVEDPDTIAPPAPGAGGEQPPVESSLPLVSDGTSEASRGSVSTDATGGGAASGQAGSPEGSQGDAAVTGHVQASKVAEQRAAEQRAAEQRAAEQRAAEQRAAEQAAAEARLRAEQEAALGEEWRRVEEARRQQSWAERCGVTDVRPPTVGLPNGTAVGPYHVAGCGAVLVKQSSPAPYVTQVRACFETEADVLTGECSGWLDLTSEWQAVVQGRSPRERLELQVRNSAGAAPQLTVWP